MLNEMVHMALHAVPFRLLWVPLDRDALERLSALGNGSAYTGEATSGRFSGSRSDFRQGGYSAMSQYKWEFTLKLLEIGYDVLVLDPDLVLKRNPLPYFETLGDCDIFSSLDAVDMEPSGENVRQAGGYVCHDKKMALNYYNTGGTLLRARPRAVAWLRGYVEWAAAQIRGGNGDDDQALFNKYINDLHALRTEQPTGHYTAAAVMNNGCLEYKRTDGDVSWLEETVASFYPLNPWMFLPSKHVTGLRLPDRILHRPYWWHANWVHGGDKQPLIANQGDWLWTGKLKAK